MDSSETKQFIFRALAKAHADLEAAQAAIAFWRRRAEAFGIGHMLFPERQAHDGLEEVSDGQGGFIRQPMASSAQQDRS